MTFYLEELRNAVLFGDNESVKVSKLGTFTIKKTSRRTFRNPKTGEPVEKDGQFTIKFKPFPSATKALNEARKGE